MTTTEPTTPSSDTPATPVVRVDQASRAIGDVTTLHPISFIVEPGQVVGIAGGSGAGKTTLLETMAGVQEASNGTVTRSAASAFVPQDDIIHHELPLQRTLEYAAALRLAEADAGERTAIVERVLRRLDLNEQADVVVGSLSGGQRKRASLAAEMLTDPSLFFLDEPTSGLDPANAAELIRALQQLAGTGSTVVVTTHAPADLARCDQVVLVARGGHVAFVGTPTEAQSFFGVDSLADIYEQLNEWPPGRAPGGRGLGLAAPHSGTQDPVAAREPSRAEPKARQQLGALVRRNIDLIRGNRLTLGILAGSPVFIIAMMTYLFPGGAFDAGDAGITLAIQTLFWMAFNSFFFGLTYGLLQVVGEFEIVKREKRAGLCLDLYLSSKLIVLVPLLAVVNVAQLAALEAANRLPDMAMADRLGMFVSLQLLSTAAVMLGLHASSAVQNSSQATLALPMLCFPQILFAGAVVPVSEMGWFPKVMSLPLAVRWAFEPLGRILDLGPQAAEQAGTAGFEAAFTGTPYLGWGILASLISLGFAATSRTLNKRTSAV